MRAIGQYLVSAAIALLAPNAALADRLIDGVALPDDLNVATAPDGMPAFAQQFAQQFLGAWVGRWSSGLKHILVVDRIQADGSVSAIYAWGDFSILRATRG